MAHFKKEIYVPPGILLRSTDYHGNRLKEGDDVIIAGERFKIQRIDKAEGKHQCWIEDELGRVNAEWCKDLEKIKVGKHLTKRHLKD